MICVLEESKPALQFWMSPQKSSNILNYLDSADLWLFPDCVLRVRVTLATLEASPLFFNLLCLDRRWFVGHHRTHPTSEVSRNANDPKSKILLKGFSPQVLHAVLELRNWSLFKDVAEKCNKWMPPAAPNNHRRRQRTRGSDHMRSCC